MDEAENVHFGIFHLVDEPILQILPDFRQSSVDSLFLFRFLGPDSPDK
jgi:hypothetical protein